MFQCSKSWREGGPKRSFEKFKHSELHINRNVLKREIIRNSLGDGNEDDGEQRQRQLDKEGSLSSRGAPNQSTFRLTVYISLAVDFNKLDVNRWPLPFVERKFPGERADF